MTRYSLKLKTKQGQHVLNNLEESTTMQDLKSKVTEATKLSSFAILVGFPPKSIDTSEESNSLKSFGINSGDTLIIEERPNIVDEDEKLARRLANEEEESRHLQSLANSSNGGEFEGILLKKVVPADNSCLFTSVGFVLNGVINTDSDVFMRQIIAQYVENDKETYNEGILGKPNSEYCEWIQKSDSWGGAIEVSILSSFYGIEIDVVDITNAIINRFGEDKNYGMRVFLLFDGIHYDPLYMESLTGGPPKTIFPIEEEGVYLQAEQIAQEAKSSRQFTDVNKFSLRCIQCDTMLVGKVEAKNHAMSTGHTNFGEV